MKTHQIKFLKKIAFVNQQEWEEDLGPNADQSARLQVALISAGQHAKEFLIEDGYMDETPGCKV